MSATENITTVMVKMIWWKKLLASAKYVNYMATWFKVVTLATNHFFIMQYILELTGNILVEILKDVFNECDDARSGKANRG